MGFESTVPFITGHSSSSFVEDVLGGFSYLRRLPELNLVFKIALLLSEQILLPKETLVLHGNKCYDRSRPHWEKAVKWMTRGGHA